MPYVTQWVEPDLLLEHQGVHVWHTYNEQEYNEPLEFWFTANPDNERTEFHFDARELPTYAEPPCPPFIHYGSGPIKPGYELPSPQLEKRWQQWRSEQHNAVISAIRAAIEQKLLDDMSDWNPPSTTVNNGQPQ